MSGAVAFGADHACGLGVVASLQELIGLRGRLHFGVLSRSGLAAAAPGRHLAARMSRGMEYSESRPYQAGDDVRALDWRQTARRGRPYTKLFQEEHERPMHLLVDMGASMRFGTRVAFKSVLAARAAALLAWRAVANGDRVGALICTGADMRLIRPQGRSQGVLSLLASLASASACAPVGGLDWAVLLQTLARTVRPGSQIAILSDFATFDVQEAGCQLLALARSAEMQLLHVYDPFEAQAPPPGCYRLSDGVNIQNLDLRSPAAQLAYEQAFAERQSALMSLARQAGVSVLPLATHLAPEMALLASTGVLRGWRAI